MAGVDAALLESECSLTGRYFITGTSTGVGKTWVASHWLTQASAQGLTCYGVKPVASGCRLINGQLCNQDALALLAASTEPLTYEEVNPFAFAPAVAPHWAAKQVGVDLSVERMMNEMAPTLQTSADLVVVEGVGGWLVPLNQRETMADFARALGYPVVLVVDMRLGCLNHALLTASAIAQAGLELAGWVANRLPHRMGSEAAFKENYAYLCEALGSAPWQMV